MRQEGGGRDMGLWLMPSHVAVRVPGISEGYSKPAQELKTGHQAVGLHDTLILPQYSLQCSYASYI